MKNKTFSQSPTKRKNHKNQRSLELALRGIKKSRSTNGHYEHHHVPKTERRKIFQNTNYSSASAVY